MKDFFISYNKHDRTWAEWIAWELEEHGFTVIIQAWDFSGNWIVDMDQAMRITQRTIAVLSPEYIQAVYTQPEWANAFRLDPTGKNNLLIPVRVTDFDPDGIFAQLVYVDLVGISEEEATERLLRRVRGERGKPTFQPTFPSGQSTSKRVIGQKPVFLTNHIREKYRKIFFSYSRKDSSEFAIKLAKDLSDRGMNVWVDQLDIPLGVSWDTEIETALESSDCVLFIISANSVSSENVLNEIDYAIDEKKKVIPILLHDCKIPIRVRRLQFIDFTKQYEVPLERLVQNLTSNPKKQLLDQESKNNVRKSPEKIYTDDLFTSTDLSSKRKLFFNIYVSNALYSFLTRYLPISIFVITVVIIIILTQPSKEIQKGSFECSNLSPADTFWIIKAKLDADYEIEDKTLTIKLKSGWITHDKPKKNHLNEKITIANIRPSIVKYIDKQIGTWDYVSKGQRKVVDTILMPNDTIKLQENTFRISLKDSVDLTECWIVFDIVLRSDQAVEGVVPLRSFLDIF